MEQAFWRDPMLPWAESRRAVASRACYRPHTHDGVSIGAVDAGQSVLQVEGRADQPLQAGDVVVVPARCVHACNPLPDLPWSYQMLYLEPGWLESLQRESLRFEPMLRAREPAHYREPTLYAQFCQLNTALFAALPSELKEAALVEFVAGLMLESTAPAPIDAPPAWLPRLAERLRHECCATWAIAQLAADAGVSRYHLIRVFRQHYGLTPHAFQLDCRIVLARQRLRDGAALAELAQALGFSDQSHFQRAFRERVSITPKDYQRQHGA